ncbi:ABC transporter ATP-binding protein [Roseiarcaceae bacterium H3SJ34-1]|uniref:hypothetical protein n=1 Tax=Terripilifer ovatus TaxID=3032367 RepID=UPI003AB95295|nr:ABC transporter ATP-binding protein [Roseiarcaceae bacterium H3SJ34-1]
MPRPGRQGKVMRQIRTLTGEGLGVLFTSHDPNQALRYADRVALLGEGRILSVGPTKDILTRDALATLYKAGVDVLTAPDGRVAFLPD